MSNDYRARLIAARTKLRLSRRQMAVRLLTPRVNYEQWEAGAEPTPGVAVLAAEAFARMVPPKKGTIRNSAAGTIGGLADGSRTAAEIAAAPGISIVRVYEVAHAAKKAGRPLKIVRSGSRTIATIRGLADGSRTAAEIAAAAGVSVATVHQVTLAEKKAGRPLAFAPSTGRPAPQTRRNAAIADAVRRGSTLAEQGAIYGMSRQAVHQIVTRYGVRASALRSEERATRTQLAQESKQEKLRKKQRREKQLIDMKLSGLTYREISARAGLGIGRLSKIFRENHISRTCVKRDLETRTMIARRWKAGEDAEQLAAEFKTSAAYVRTLANSLGFHRRTASSRQKAASK